MGETRYLWVRMGIGVSGPDVTELELSDLVDAIADGLKFESTVGRYTVYNDYAPDLESFEDA